MKGLVGGVGGIAAPPSYEQLLTQINSLESFAESCNNDEAARLLS